MADEFTGNPWNDFSLRRDCLHTANAFRPGFHGDLQLIEIIEKLLKDCSVFIETGAYHGCTSYYVSKNFKDKECFTCELNRENYTIAKNNLSDSPNVTILNTNSIEFLKKIIETHPHIKQETCLFWLDAHGDAHDEGPALDEVAFIINNFQNYYIFIDDIDTPNTPTREQFSLDWISNIYDSYSFYYVPTYTEKTGYAFTGWLLTSNKQIDDLPHSAKFDF